MQNSTGEEISREHVISDDENHGGYLDAAEVMNDDNI